MKINFNGKKAFILSSTRGIGFAVANELSKLGAEVYIHGKTSLSVNKALSQFSNKKVMIHGGISGDLYSSDDQKSIAKFIRLNKIDILIINSGGPASGEYDKLTSKQFKRETDMIIDSAVSCINAAIPYMKKREFGRIINISSISLFKPIPSLPTSNASRSYLHGLMVGLSVEYAQYGITLNTICPGIILTDRQINLAKKESENSKFTADQIMINKKNQIPKGEMGKPEDIAYAVCFFSSEYANYITGQKISIDGGLLGIF
ncbi:MAG: SDR family oxidoreductase [Methylophilaceae bacterium]